jgi:hypothetical protein
MKKLFTLLLIAGYTMFIASCGHCSGCDEVKTIVGAQIITNDSVNTNYSSSVIILIQRKTTSKSGDRNCQYKDLVTCLEDDLNSANMTLKSNKDLALSIGTILANENLLTIKPLIDTTYPSSIYLATLKLGLTNYFVKGNYTFTLEGTTQDGKAYKDTTNIVFY